MPATPLYNRRAFHMIDQQFVVVTDLHIGLEYDLSLRGAQIPAQSHKLTETVCKILDETKAKKLVVAGDLKHIIRPGSSSQEYQQALRQERIDVSSFISRITELTELTLISGNHDGGMQYYGSLTVTDATGTPLSRTTSCAHGHAWPAADIMMAETLIIGHVHPVVRLRNALGHTSLRTCWVRAPLNVQAAQRTYPDANVKMEVIIMPAFNPLCGGTAVNAEGLLGPMRNIIDISRAQVYLLDGTYLGVIKDL